MATSSSSVGLLKQLSRQSSSGLGDEFSFKDEMELLQNVYIDELEITPDSTSSTGDTILTFQVSPSTADDKDKQFVYIEVVLSVDGKYPNSKPQLTFAKSRGLSDSHLDSISLGVGQLAAGHLGTPMIYDLIEYIRDCLTNNNRPYGKCVLCQYDFQDDDKFVRTYCYHYFHSHCIFNYIQYCKTTIEEDFDQTRMKKKFTTKKLECPVCRVILDKDSLSVTICEIKPNHQDHDDFVFKPSKSLLAWQERMSVLYQKQLAKGGIITDTDDVIDVTWVSSKVQSNDCDVTKQDTPTTICDDSETDINSTGKETKESEQNIQQKGGSQNRNLSMHNTGSHGNSCPRNNVKKMPRTHGVKDHGHEGTKTTVGTGKTRKSQEKWQHHDRVVIIVHDKDSRQHGKRKNYKNYSRSDGRPKEHKDKFGTESQSKSGIKTSHPVSQSRNESVHTGNEPRSESVCTGNEPRNESVHTGNEQPRNESVCTGNEPRNEPVQTGNELRNESVHTRSKPRNESVGIPQ